MACGCPVLASDISSLRERCGDSAQYCNPEDINDIAEKIIRLINDQNLQKSLVGKGLIRSQEMTWERCANKTIEIFNLLSNKYLKNKKSGN
jgi:glycosyltransferase involved in cell wall biosynthesis